MSEIINNDKGINEKEILIKNTLKQLVENYREKGIRKNSWITNELKILLGDLGKDLGYLPKSTVENSEWLFDLTWLKLNEKGFISSIVLALESELSNRSIASLRHDFEKLLVVNAEIRVMFCFGEGNSKRPDNVNNIITGLQEVFDNYEELPKGFRIVLFIWDDYMTDKIIPHVLVKD